MSIRYQRLLRVASSFEAVKARPERRSERIFVGRRFMLSGGMTDPTPDMPRRSTQRRRKTSRAKAAPRDAITTRENLLNAALKIFAEGGFGGGRINRISRAARSNDRMIYYYFGSKERLFVEVLEKVYSDMWAAESALELESSQPRDALAKVINFTLDYYLAHPEMLAILNNENLHKGKYVSKSKRLKEVSSPALGLIEGIYRRGVESGAFRPGIQPLHLYLSILALNYFYVSNRYTLSAFLDTNLTGEGLVAWREWIAGMILRTVEK